MLRMLVVPKTASDGRRRVVWVPVNECHLLSESRPHISLLFSLIARADRFGSIDPLSDHLRIPADANP
jgi:hypothetical protein